MLWILAIVFVLVFGLAPVIVVWSSPWFWICIGIYLIISIRSMLKEKALNDAASERIANTMESKDTISKNMNRLSEYAKQSK